MRERPPVQMVDGNLIAGRYLDDVWAVFVIPGHSYRAESRSHQEQMAASMAEYSREANANFQVLAVSSRWSEDDYVRQMREHMPARAHVEHYDMFLEEQRQLIAQRSNRTGITVLSVRLAGAEMDRGAQISRLAERSREDWRREVKTLFLDRKRMAATVVLKNTLRLQRNLDRERIAFDRVRMFFPDARPIEPLEMQWLIRRMFSRGLREPEISPSTPFTQPDEARTVLANWLSEYVITREHGYLKVAYPGGECFQTALCAGTVADSQEFSRESELMFSVLERHEFPIDACLNVRWVPNDQAVRKAGHAYKQIAHEFLDEEKGELGAMHPSRERAELAHEYHAELSKEGDPQLQATLSYFLSGDSRKQLEARVEAFRHLYPHACHRPLVDQLDVFRSHWPGQPTHIKDYERIYTPTQIGAMVPHASHDAGSSKPWAFYYAYTLDGNQPVRIDLREASDTDGAPMIAFVSSLGGGKTVGGQLFFYHAFLRGAWIVDIDPKGDHRWYELPQVRDHARVIEIGDDISFRGMLDPLRVALANERQLAASTFLCEVIGTTDEMIEAGVHGAVGKVIESYGEKACCTEVVKALLQSGQPEFHRAGLELEQYQGSGIVRLGFADLSDPLVSKAESQVTVIKSRVLQNLGAGERATQAQRHSRAVMQMIVYQGRKLLGTEPDVLKLMSFDEAGTMTGDALVSVYIDQCSRWSRSDLLTPMLLSQDPADVRGQRNRIGQWFLGKMKSKEQTEEMLRELELDATSAMVSRIGSYRPGQFLKKDLAGHCEEIQIDPGARLLGAFKTRPPEEQLAREAA